MQINNDLKDSSYDNISGNYPIRRETKPVFAGNLQIGGNAPISVQSMTNIPIKEIDKTLKQIIELKQNGASLVRVALRTENDAEYIKQIKREIDIPICADIHFNYKIALKAIENGVDKIRINPGNIGDNLKIKILVEACKERNIPIRIGVNAGSVNLKKYKHVNEQTLVESALEHVELLEQLDYTNIVVSIKSSDPWQTIKANRLFAKKRNYPIHIGLTEAGFGLDCIIKSSMVIGTLLFEGIGDTIRLSMTGDPVEEVKIAKKILQNANLLYSPVKIISCPTCGRTDESLDLLTIATLVKEKIEENFEQFLIDKKQSITVAVMGCEVNGPGEAKHADCGIAGARNGKVVLFARGQKKKIISVENIIDELIKTIKEDILNID